LSTDQYSGVGLSYFPRNWTGYDYLIFSVYNPGKSELKLTCRVNDFQHIAKSQSYGDRFNRTYDLHKGWNDIRIALKDIFTAAKSRMMDAECIQHFGIFATNLPEPCIIYLDHIYLN
jgi:hypothetical protein